jgi:hypothetical protein
VSTGTVSTQFAIQTGSGTTCPVGGGSLAGGASCTVAVTFTPTSLGFEDAELNIFSSNFGSPSFPSRFLYLSGTGTPNLGPPLTITAVSTNGSNGTTETLLAGDTGVYTLIIQPAAGFTGTIMVSCQELTPIPATIFTASPSTITVTTSPSGPITVTCTLQTNCNTALVGPRPPWNAPPWTPPPFAAVLLLAMLAAMRWRRSETHSVRSFARQIVPIGAMLLLVLLMLTWTACVNNPKPILPGSATTPAGVYNLQVVATVTSTGQTVKLPLTVHII